MVLTKLDALHKEFIARHLQDDVRSLALTLKAKPQGMDADLLIRQIKAKQMLRYKLPQWYVHEEVLFPPSLSIEQASSELTANYKAGLCAGSSLVDLTGGLGVDTLAFAERFTHISYVENQEQLCELAKHNFPLLCSKPIEVICDEAIAYAQTMPAVDCIYIDPARRNQRGEKTVLVSDCTPDVSQSAQLLLSKAKKVLVKLSPMLDISLALQDLPQTQEVHIVSVDNECKELLFVLSPAPVSEVQLYAVQLSTKHAPQVLLFSRQKEQESKLALASALGKYLYEPNSSILKAGAFKSISAVYKLQKLHIDSHLYTSDQLHADFPGRVFAIEACIPFTKSLLKEGLQSLSKANISLRNFPISVEEIRKKTKLKPGGEVYLFATTLWNAKKVLIRCEKIR